MLATGLSALYSSLPRKIEVRGDDWHALRREDWMGVSSLVLFMNSLEFCNAVVQVAHPTVRCQLLDYLHNGFLVPVMGPALHKVETKYVSDNIYAGTILIRKSTHCWRRKTCPYSLILWWNSDVLGKLTRVIEPWGFILLQINRNSCQKNILRYVLLFLFVFVFLLVISLCVCVLQSSVDEMIASTAYLDLFLRSVTDTSLLKTFLRFILLHRHDNDTILDTLLTRISSNSRVCIYVFMCS